jgi:hypothetical protein
MQGFCDKIGANCNEIVGWAGQDKFELPEESMERLEDSIRTEMSKMESEQTAKLFELSVVIEQRND